MCGTSLTVSPLSWKAVLLEWNGTGTKAEQFVPFFSHLQSILFPFAIPVFAIQEAFLVSTVFVVEANGACNKRDISPQALPVFMFPSLAHAQ
jgi:hypothetical protein